MPGVRTVTGVPKGIANDYQLVTPSARKDPDNSLEQMNRAAMTAARAGGNHNVVGLSKLFRTW